MTILILPTFIIACNFFYYLIIYTYVHMYIHVHVYIYSLTLNTLIYSMPRCRDSSYKAQFYIRTSLYLPHSWENNFQIATVSINWNYSFFKNDFLSIASSSTFILFFHLIVIFVVPFIVNNINIHILINVSMLLN